MTDPDQRQVTPSQYSAAFEGWGAVYLIKKRDAKRLGDTLSASLAHLRDTFPDNTPRPIREYCGEFGKFLDSLTEAAPLHPWSNHWVHQFRFDITKSCFLWRTLYLGESPRMVKCPLHGGIWSGWGPERCPYGCDRTCGCLTGWLPPTG